MPLLEQSFDDNAFPSRLEKFELAAKCDMGYKQIHVWVRQFTSDICVCQRVMIVFKFQNRRSRSRKEGKELKRRLPTHTLTKELENAVMEALLPAPEVDVDDQVNGMIVSSGISLTPASFLSGFHSNYTSG